MEDELGNYYIRKYDRLHGERENWQSHWEQVAKYTQPNKDDVYTRITKGEKKHNRIYDSTSIQANKLLASALHGMLTSPSSKWFGMAHPIPEVNEDTETRLWLDDSVGRMIRVLNNSNFQSQIHEVYLDLGGVSTGTLFMGEHPKKVIYFDAKPVYDFVLQENNFGVVDTVGKCVEYTLKELIDEFGEDNIPADVINQGNSHMERRFEVIHFVEPNKEYDKSAPKIDTNKPIRSIHILRKTRTVLKTGGFHSMPYAVPRWAKYAGEKYGRGPGMETLPDAKMLNAMMKVSIRGAQKVVDPPLIVPDHGFALPLDQRPGGVIYKRAGVQDQIVPLNTGARPDIGEDMMESARLRIRQAFFIDQLQLVQQNNMTATEVMQRTEENLRLMGPIFGRLDNELLRPIVDRLFDIMMRRNMFLPLPDVLKQAGGELDVEYISQIAKAQKTGEADTLNRVIQSMMPIIESQPQVMDNFNGDAILRFNSDMFGLPEKLLNSPDQVGEIRKGRQQAQDDADAAALNNQDADTAQKLANAQATAQEQA